MNITEVQAESVLKAAISKVKEIKVPMNIAIMDEGANLKLFYRMDGALLGSADIAIKKAKTSRLFEMNSEKLGELSQPGESLFNVEHSNGGLISFAGGLVLKNNNDIIIGSIGVSGGTVAQDFEVANAGSEALLNNE
ncbi:GlcG/HbpS family heme-binding protein [Sinomicrobium sp. M5D2P17]